MFKWFRKLWRKWFVTMPSRHGRGWTPRETTEFANLVEAGKGIEYIAKKLHRTENAIVQKGHKLGLFGTKEKDA